MPSLNIIRWATLGAFIGFIAIMAQLTWGPEPWIYYVSVFVVMVITVQIFSLTAPERKKKHPSTVKSRQRIGYPRR